jgi:periplasmic protein TonB
MSHRNHVRAAQTVVLRDSLAGSSMSILTLVVAAMITLRLLGDTVTTRIIEIPPFEIPRHEGEKITPMGDAPPVVVPPSEVTDVADIVPVEPDVAPPVDVPIVSPTKRDAGGDPHSNDGGDGLVRNGPGGGGPGPGPIPASTVHIWHEEIPRIVTRVLPVYPDLARQAGLEGKVMVAAFIGVDGRVRAVEVEGMP